MRKIIQLPVALLAVAAILFGFPASAAYAEDGDADGRALQIVSDMGDHERFPENSVPAIRSAVEQGADMVRLPVQKTADGVLVLSEDPDLSRLCGVDETPIARLESARVLSLPMRVFYGGSVQTTDQTVPSLADVLKTFAGQTKFMLDFDFSIRDDVYAAVKNAGMTKDCSFVLRAGAKKAAAWKNTLDAPVKYWIYRKTNIIFSALSALKTAEEDSDGSVFFATSNAYGVIFGGSVGKRLSKTSGAAVRISEKELAGKRLDTADYWDNLIETGYNVLITDRVAALAEYRDESVRARTALSEYTQTVKSTFQPEDLRSPAYRKMRFAYSNAMNDALRLSAKTFAGKAECENAKFALSHAVDEIEMNHEKILSGEADLRLTPGRILTAILTVAAFAALEIFIAKKRGGKTARPKKT